MEEGKQQVSIEMADMIGKTYFKVATWFNQDFNEGKERQDALKHVCAEIVQQILEDTFLQIDGIGAYEAKTVKNSEVPERPINQTSTGTGKIINISEDVFTRALRGK
jgi:hypothetical protein